MYKNVGRKLKDIAKLITIFQIIFFAGISLVCFLRLGIVIGVISLVGGIIIAWLSTLLIYAIGQFVDNSDMLVNIADSLEEELNEINDSLDEMKENQDTLISAINSINKSKIDVNADTDTGISNN